MESVLGVGVWGWGEEVRLKSCPRSEGARPKLDSPRVGDVPQDLTPFDLLFDLAASKVAILSGESRST